MSRSRHDRADAGVTIVEAAFALPILLLFIFGLVDMGMWTFNSNQATNAAKDGARAAILDYEQADVVGSGDWNAVVAKVESHLDRDIGAGEITIECVDDSGTAISGGCAAAEPDLGDRVRVAVDWNWHLVTPVASVIGLTEGKASGTATMALIGLPVGTETTVPPDTEPPPPPPTTEPPPGPVDCTINNLKVGANKGSNSVIHVKSNGQLWDHIWVSFDTNGVERCNGLAVQLIAPDGETTRSAVCGDCVITNDHDWEYYDNNEKIWKIPSGSSTSATVRIFNEFVDVTGSFTLSS